MAHVLGIPDMMFYERINVFCSLKFKQEDLVNMALLDESKGVRKSKGMDVAVSSTEKIRTWVKTILL